MPIYEYHCLACDRNFEELVFNSSHTVVCPDCQSESCEKLMSASSFFAKGSDGSTVSSSAGSSSCGSCSSSSCGTCGCGG